MQLAGSAPAGRRSRFVWAGGAAAGVALLQFLQQELQAFHLNTWVLSLISLLILVAGLGIGQWRQVQAAREAARAFDAALDEALACWPPRAASTFSPDDVGVHPRLDVPLEQAPYVPRDADEALGEAIRDDALVVVFGPPGAGKSRSAFQAVQDQAGDAVLLMPEDAKGLKALVAQTPAAVLERDTQAVLWLEGLEHYLDGLDVDALMRFLRWADSSRIVLVATIREDALDRLLKSPEREGLVTRRLLSHGRGVFVGGEFSDAELAAFEERCGRRPDGRSIAAAFPQNWRGGWLRCAAAGPAPSSARAYDRDVVTPALAALFAIVAGALVIVGQTYGWTVAPPIEDQVRALADDIRPCQRLDAHPAAGAGLEKARDPTAKVLVAVVSGADCLDSDEVRFYRRGSDDRLKRIGSLRPVVGDSRWSFSCIGGGRSEAASDPCHVTLHGKATSIVGAWRDDETQQELPVVVSFEPEGLRLRALSLPKADVPEHNARTVTLRLRAAGSAPAASDGEQCLQTRGCLAGRTAAAVAVLPPSRGAPSLLLTSYGRGAPQAPDAVRLRVWKLDFRREEPQRGRDCLVLVKGRPHTPRIRNPAISELRDVLLRAWRPRGADVMC